ncbi:uncharacterized protein METZ01_LOCUS122357 [marine metagenome]|uniref:Uncharacterized protein n=1 Tax=marine metagenome TaxID=408172 RepID=A0A381XZ43_9ZZZZ
MEIQVLKKVEYMSFTEVSDALP